MATFDDVANIARTYLRDFPRFFQTSLAVAGRTYQLGHVNVDSSSLYVAVYIPSGGAASALSAAEYSLDVRNGVLRLAESAPVGAELLIEGYYYEWVTPDDLNFYTKRAIEKHLIALETSLSNLTDVVINAIGIAAIVECLWALMTEYSRDIDVITSESVHIPASQRFRMVQSLLSQWRPNTSAMPQPSTSVLTVSKYSTCAAFLAPRTNWFPSTSLRNWEITRRLSGCGRRLTKVFFRMRPRKTHYVLMYS